MNTRLMEDLQQPRFWGTLGTAIVGLARRAGCSARDCPLPEIREAARDIDEWTIPSTRAPEQRAAA
jgi:hypothetical protein